MDPTPVSVVVSYPAGGTIFIGAAVQFQAQEMLNNGTTRMSSTATWASDNPAVATVGVTGLVTAVSAGQATISASVANVPGAFLLIRVYPNFGGTWTGLEVVATCSATGDLAGLGLCDDDFALGSLFGHGSTLTQAEASVNAVIDGGDGFTATTSGTISVGGELTLSPAPFLPADPEIGAAVENWRTRSDVPSQMTGAYDLVFTASGLSGEWRVGLSLQNVVKAGGAAALGEPTSGGIGRRSAGEQMRLAIERLRPDF